jgi:cytoskeletal protein RodZ
MTKAIKNANHMNQNVKKSNKGRIVALALAGILAVGGITGAVCAAGLGKMPSQAPVAAQTVAAKPAAKATTKKAAQATPKAETKASQSQAAKKTATKQAATKSDAKPATKQAEAKSAAKQAAPAPAAKKAEAPKQEAQPAPRQEEQKAAPAGNVNDGTEAKLSREQCVKIACDYVGAGGQAKGPAMNVSAKRVVGGGTTYYAVELDLGDVHYRVCVDAIDGHTYSSDMTHAGTTVCLDEQGNPIEGTEQPAEA